MKDPWVRGAKLQFSVNTPDIHHQLNPLLWTFLLPFESSSLGLNTFWTTSHFVTKTLSLHQSNCLSQKMYKTLVEQFKLVLCLHAQQVSQCNLVLHPTQIHLYSLTCPSLARKLNRSFVRVLCKWHVKQATTAKLHPLGRLDPLKTQ